MPLSPGAFQFDLQHSLEVARPDSAPRPLSVGELPRFPQLFLSRVPLAPRRPGNRVDAFRRETTSPRRGAPLRILQVESEAHTETFDTLQRNLSPRPITLADLPDELRRKFVGKNGRLLIQVHPKVNIWEKEGARSFVSELRSVDPEVTGPPVITYEATILMERAYVQGTAYAFGVVGALSLLMIRRVRDTALAILPLALGLV